MTFADETVSEMVEDSDLHKELLRRVEIDQEVRAQFADWFKKNPEANGLTDLTLLPQAKQDAYKGIADRLTEIDNDNTKWLKGIIKVQGWPTKELVGKDGAKAAWLLVQHADADPKFQRQCLDLITALPKGDVASQEIAYLTDRVLLAEGKQQLYGTQFISVDGRFEPRPIEDEKNVDKRRAEMGLPSLAFYRRMIHFQYGSIAKPAKPAKPAMPEVK